MGPEESGKRLHTVKLMEPEFLLDYCNESSADIIRGSQFIPYSFKELNEVDLVEFSALQALKMIKYVTAVQRHCIPVDVFFWTIFNTDAEGDRLVIKGANGNAHVIGWPEIAVAFGSQHDPKEEFRSTKVMQSKLRNLHPDLFLPQAVESNPNKKLVNGQRYEECLYYREAAPYGPTYYLMTQTNWAKAILHSLRMEISSLQNRGSRYMAQVESHDQDGDMTLSSLVARFPDPIINLQDVRENCLLLEQIPLATPLSCTEIQPYRKGYCRTKITVKRKRVQNEAPRENVLEETSQYEPPRENVLEETSQLQVQENSEPGEKYVTPVLDVRTVCEGDHSVKASTSCSPPANLQQLGQLLGSEVADLVILKCKDFWREVQEEAGNASTWKRKHDDLLRANGEFTSRLAEKDKNFLAKEVEWKNTLKSTF
ncbi:hypothetical protein R1sor_010436 [Riccia sorocarpa]|uniref:Uncharacterized protein n=1 Tax=Riccia sorocarpa TaxID=122646 RepID=A0ABD3HY11_9MARC